jgi:hypothetical protein
MFTSIEISRIFCQVFPHSNALPKIWNENISSFLQPILLRHWDGADQSSSLTKANQDQRANEKSLVHRYWLGYKSGFCLHFLSGQILT